MRGSSRTRSSKPSPTHSRSRLTALWLLTCSASALLFADNGPGRLEPVATRDQKVVRRWQLPGDPRGVAIGADGTIYAGLAGPQAVIAVDPSTGNVLRRLVLDSAEIASTKELVTLRTNADRSRLYIANGSDESATILSLPDLTILREITMEGEAIRDAVPDPRGRFLYLLGRRLHVFDAGGKSKLRTIPFDDPMAVAVSSAGTTLALLGTEDFGSARATVAAFYETSTFSEIAREPLQTDRRIESALFADGDRSLVAFSRDSMFEKHLIGQAPKTLTETKGGGPMRMQLEFGDFVNSDRICLPEGAGPQIAAVAPGNLVLFAERRCSTSGNFTGSVRRIVPASLYGVNAYAIAYDADRNTLAATDRAGYLTIYRVPRPAPAR